MEWTGGYVSDIGYTASFYREMAPSHMAFTAIALGRSPGRALRPKRYLELGFGQGFGLALLAAANPDVEFEGCDFNPQHVAHARRLIGSANLANLTVSEASFEEMAGQGRDNDTDLIALHGILSWVSSKAQDAIISILRQRLQPDGLVYVSYNCMPGWAPLAPIQLLLREVKRRNPGSSDRQLAAGLDLLSKLKQGGAAYFTANATAGSFVDSMLKLDRNYLAHEFLHEHWELFHFADIVSKFNEAKMSYLGSATLTENVDAFSVPQPLLPLLAQIGDPVLREAVRDMAANKRFRRDIFARGVQTLTAGEHRTALANLGFALTVPRQRVAFRAIGPLGSELTGAEWLYGPIADLLAQKNSTFNELLALPVLGESKIGLLLESLAFFIHSGQVVPYVLSPAADPEPARRFNHMVAEFARAGRQYHSLASPVLRTGIAAGEFQILALAAIYDGKADTPEMAGAHMYDSLRKTNRAPLKDGKPIDTDAAAVEFLADMARPVLQDTLPVWRRLGIV